MGLLARHFSSLIYRFGGNHSNVVSSTTRLYQPRVARCCKNITTSTTRCCSSTAATTNNTMAPLLTLPLVNNDIVFSTLTGMVSDIWNGLLWAAPKQKRSLAKRRWLRSFRRMEPRRDIEDCVVCGHKKLMGRLCKNCFSLTMSLTEEVWAKDRADKYRKDRYIR